jgi:hypothetical protein
MSNQQKAEFVSDIFCIQSLWGDHGKISPKNLIYTGWCNLPRNADSATDGVFNCHNSQIANRLQPFDGPLKN